jgi:predicted transcriptional regulator
VAFSRVGRADLSARRQAVLEAIQAQPGVTQEDLQRLRGFTRSTVRFNVHMLVSSGLVIERQEGNHTRLFEAKGRGTQLPALLFNPDLRQLFDFVVANPERTRNRIAFDAKELWGWSRSTTYHRLGRLIQDGLLVVEEGWGAPIRAVPLHTRLGEFVSTTPQNVQPSA